MLQLLLTGISTGAVYGLVAIGFVVIYRTARVLHIAHAAVFTIAPYAAYYFVNRLHIPIGLALGLSIGLCGLSGAAMEVLLYRPLRRRQTTPLTRFLASMGLYTVLVNFIALAAGDDTLSLFGSAVRATFRVGTATLTAVQAVIVMVAVACACAGIVFVGRSWFGKQLRCVAGDPELARIVGVDVDRVLLIAAIAGSILGGLAGILYSADVDLRPLMGLHVFIFGLIAAMLGGTATIHGPFLGGLAVGALQNLSVLVVGSEWQDAVMFTLLIAIIVLRRPRTVRSAVVGET